MFLQNYVHRYIVKIYTNTQAWLHFWDERCSLSVQVYTGLFEYKPTLKAIKGELLDAQICTLSRLTTLVTKIKNIHGKFKSRSSQSNTMWSQLRSTGGAGNHTEATMYLVLLDIQPFWRALRLMKQKEYSQTVRTSQHNLCSSYGLCPSIYEYLATPGEIKHPTAMWLKMCRWTWERERGKKKDHIPGFNWC